MSLSTQLLLQAAPALLVFVVIWVSIGYWIYADALARGCSDAAAFRWAVVSAVVIPIGAVYLFTVRGSDERNYPRTRRERLAGTLAGSGLVALVASAVLAPPDPVTQLRVLPVAFAVIAAATYLYEFRIDPTGS